MCMRAGRQREDDRERMLDGRVSSSAPEHEGSGQQLELTAVHSSSDAEGALEEGSGNATAGSAKGPDKQEGAVSAETASRAGGLANGREGQERNVNG